MPRKPVPKKPAQAKPAKRTVPSSGVHRIHDSRSFPIVGIGASAGGLEALEAFFSHMPPDPDMAFVVIQHLSPAYKSIMASLLEKHTRMKVEEITDGVHVRPNVIYLNPPGKNVALMNGALHLIQPQEAHGVNLSIDCFFRTLAEDQGDKAICVVLSGAGTDGTLGLKAVKGAGGLTLAQAEGQAKYSGMPRSAIDTGLVDIILLVEKMPAELVRFARHPYMDGGEKKDSGEGAFKQYVDKIFLHIRTHTGHDFSHYKRSTIRRRIERRMAVHQIDRVADYARYIQKTPAEADLLFKDLLIGVTNFFRDKGAFETLREKVLPDLLKDRSPDNPLRVWVPGCSTGEEAYSLAMLLFEAMEEMQKRVDFQIFATDLDQTALERARLAVYPDSIAADVSPERLKRFFAKEDNFYKIKKKVRETVVFAAQNLIKDPPFSRLDLVSCRNLLIYMDSALQKKVLPLFHYTLVPGGILFLGSSETIGDYVDLFKPVDAKWKIFRRKETALKRNAEYQGAPFFETRSLEKRKIGSAPEGTAGKLDIRNLIERFILDNYGPPCVLINERQEVLYFIGQTDRYLTPPAGEPSFHLLKMAREGLRYKLSAAIHQALQQKKTVMEEGVRIKQDSDFRIVDLVIRPFVEPEFPQNLLMVLFKEKTQLRKEPSRKKGKKTGDKDADPRVASLEQELYSTKEYLQTTIEELETSNEELKSTNEELQSVNEELQSANEEMETSKEELQSTNEELITMNAESQKKVEELSQANDDMNNLLASTEIGTIFLDPGLRIKRFTPAISRIFNLIPSDINRPIGDITSNILDAEIQKEAGEALEHLRRAEKKILARDGRRYSMRVMPYRTTEDVIDGVVVTFIDISDMGDMESLRRLATVVSDSNDAIAVHDLHGNITAWNKGAARMYGYAEREALKMNILEITPQNKRKEMLGLIKKIGKGGRVRSFLTKRLAKDGREIAVWLTATSLTDNHGKTVAVATTERDLTELERLKKKKKNGKK